MSQIWFNTILEQSGLSPQDVNLIRHQENRGVKGLTPYTLWRDNRPLFESYQSRQSISNRTLFSRPWWASFVATPSSETMFVGIYASKRIGELQEDSPHALGGEPERAGQSDIYELTYNEEFRDFEGRLFIDWGPGYRSWGQIAGNKNKPITELRRRFTEPEFPGLANFSEPLSRVTQLPQTWVEVLKNAKGIYLITCPRTNQHYIGSASGEDGFYGRWLNHAATGYGDAVELRNRPPSDYQISILEVAGSTLQINDIVQLESKWKERLKTREVGLNSN